MHVQLFFVVLCTYLVRLSLACNGYDLKVNYVKNCISNSVIQVKDVTATLDKDCNIIPSGCASVTKAIKNGQVHYKIKKGSVPAMEGDIEICETLAGNKKIGPILTIFGMPTKCPILVGKVCNTNGKKLNITDYKNQLGILVGTTEVKLDVVHDNGGKSCLEISMTMQKK